MLLTFVGAVWHLDIKYTFKTEEMRSQLTREKQVNSDTENKDEEVL